VLVFWFFERVCGKPQNPCLKTRASVLVTRRKVGTQRRQYIKADAGKLCEKVSGYHYMKGVVGSRFSSWAIPFGRSLIAFLVIRRRQTWAAVSYVWEPRVLDLAVSVQ
jgi:hypothetical protein